MSTFLIERNGRFDGPLFSSMPPPKNIADKHHMGDALSAMEDKQNESDDENELISSVDRTLAQQAPDHISTHKRCFQFCHDQLHQPISSWVYHSSGR